MDVVVGVSQVWCKPLGAGYVAIPFLPELNELAQRTGLFLISELAGNKEEERPSGVRLMQEAERVPTLQNCELDLFFMENNTRAPVMVMMMMMMRR